MRLFQNAARFLLLAALAYSPWDYGGVTEPAIVRLNWILAGALAAFAASAAVRCYLLRAHGHRKTSNHSPITDNSYHPRAVAPALWLPIIAILALGWWASLNAKAIYDADASIFIGVKRWLPWAAGSVDQAVSAASMVRVTVLLGTMLMVADLVRDPRWLLRLWWTLGLTGSSIALLGLLQKASGAQMIFWQESKQTVGTFFATFYYHGNAGAFLNLTLPVTIGLAWRAFAQRRAPLVRALWLTLSVISIVAAFANTSRMGQALAGGVLLVLAAGLLPRAFGAARARMAWPTAVAGAVAILFALFAVVQNSRLDRSLDRWERISETMPRDSRWNAAKAAWGAVPEAGWHGFGPGTFAIVFPYYTADWGKNLSGRWIFLHQDYVQTLMEWGWLGSGLLGWLFFGGIGVGAWRAGKSRKWKVESRKAEVGSRREESGDWRSSESGKWKVEGERAEGGNRESGIRGQGVAGWTPRQRLFVPLVVLGLASVALHALVDFPLQIASIQLYVATYLGVCWGSSRFAGRVVG